MKYKYTKKTIPFYEKFDQFGEGQLTGLFGLILINPEDIL
jgi:hypothetical protein